MGLSRQEYVALLCLVLISLIEYSQSRHLTVKRQKREHGAQLYLPASYVIPGGEGEGERWGPWGAPSECSRTCGGGVAYQTRECHDVDQNDQPRCRGGSKKYFSCNTQDCPEAEEDFRQQQCAHFNDIPIEGIRYEWVPYTKAPNPCELNCMPRGERFYYRHKSKVIDGTRCNEESLDVCVDGTCQPVGCDMMLGSDAKEDKCRQCHGDGSSCKTINGTLDMDNLQMGYNDILLIPSGASNIEIREVKTSNNYLAIRNLMGTYYLNGNWRIDFPRPMSYAGGIWHYERQPQGFAAPDHLTCMGPTTEALYLVLLYQDVNVGIHYEYSIPENTVKQTEHDTYNWVFGPYTECSATCGGGFQTRNVTCNSRTTLKQVDDSLCDATEKLEDARQCGQEPCAPRWMEGPWGKCSEGCGKEGNQEREVKCERVSATGVTTIIEDKQCLESVGNKPATVQECNRGVVCPKWHLGPWSPCDKLCGEGKQTRQVRCYRKEKGKIEVLADGDCPEEKPAVKQECVLRPCEGVDWITSPWSGCKSCGLSVETRSAHCASKDGKIYNETFCANRQKPELQRDCESTPKCEHQWFTSQWSKCSAECGKGVQTRTIVCGHFDGEFVKRANSDSDCDEKEKPEEKRECEGPEECPGQWFTGPWSECSVKCGGGEKSRKVICLANNKPVAPSKCDEETIAFGTESCNPDACVEDETIPVDSSSTPMMDDDESEEYCDDEDYVLTASGEQEEDEDDTSVTNAMDSSDSSSDVFDMEETSATESSLITDDLMLSDATGFETESTSSDTVTEMTGSTIEGSGSEVSLLARLGEDGEGSGDSDSTTIASSTVSDLDEITGTEVTEETVVSSSISQLTSDITAESSSAASVSTESADVTTESASSEASVSTEGSASTESSAGTSEVSESTESSSATETTEASESTDATDTTDPTDTTDTTDATDTTEPTETTEATDTTESTDMSSTETSESSTESSKSSTEDGTSIQSEITTIASEISETTEAQTSSSVEGSSVSDSQTTTEIVTESSGLTSEGSTVSVSESSESDTQSTLIEETTTGAPTDSSESTTEGSSESTTLAETDTTGETDVTESSSDSVTDATVKSRFEDDDDTTSSDDIDIWSTTASSTDEDDLWGTTPNTLEQVVKKEQKPRKCKPRPKTPGCVKSTYGCCSDNSTAAKGPFDEGCPIPKTCTETKHGCCPDKVTPAKGSNNKGCPKSLCGDSLFGCCPDKVTEAQGNDNEGCPVVTVPPPKGCADSKFGCCPDGKTKATGPKNKGCKEDKKEDKPKPEETKPTDETKKEEPKEEESSKGCAHSTYGCCPDGLTEATGEKFHGCDIIDDDDCKKSYYGCCGDNKTPAKGENQEGCASCIQEQFGCCPDGATPAHGPNGEGCCLDSQFGCCPDNIMAARGPNLEGCGCEYSSYGCCPDNTTTAKGHDNYGCGCQFSEHGCCLDKKTEAKGPKYEGCPCETFQFGCCPDGVTIPTGPHNYGCYCTHSEFKCCGDGTTHAKGPNGEGCTCAESKFGCCPDGTTEAQGTDFEGCENKPTSPQKACSLKKDSGPCKNYTVKSFFDEEYGACSRFWYGGCDGNDNRFETLDECKDTCETPTGKEACQLPQVHGPCTGYMPMWSYDYNKKQCVQFIYGGCLGNNNRFETIEECQSTCAAEAALPPCSQPLETGPCNGSFERWFFDENTDDCQPFRYGGCKGNKNNFQTEASCKYMCKKPGIHRDTCDLPTEKGKCGEKQARWAYSTNDNKCMPFYYTGCEGNKNNYRSEQECEASCPQEIEKDFCSLPADIGNCQNYTARWYFNTMESRCKQFYYGGCEGNKNNFAEQDECLKMCEKKEEEPAPKPIQRPQQTEFRREYCQLDFDSGDCDQVEGRWYFNYREGICDQFSYGGCGGNGNNFGSEEECLNRCDGVRDTCSLPPVRGPCDDIVERWYYNDRAQRCERFQYGSCRGNKNNFLTEGECQSSCNRSQPTSEDICDAPRDHGDGDTRELKYFYNRETTACEAFTYTGSGGNGNRFESHEQCERQCGEYKGIDVCSQPQESGPCDQWQTKYYYDSGTRKCGPFTYSGCEGTGNRFVSMEECESICISHEETPTDSKAICKLPVESGKCQSEPDSHRRFYFDDDRNNCVTFIYNGCGGNQNNFRSYESCMSFCYVSPTQAEPEPEPEEDDRRSDHCEKYSRACDGLRCHYEIHTSYNEEGCRVCSCDDPCSRMDCPQGSVCAVDIENDPSSGTSFVAVCRESEKPGNCPQLGNSSSCDRDCYSDADCRGDKKCCAAGCGYVCVSPDVEATRSPARPSVPIYPGSYAPQLEERKPEEVNVQSSEGGFAILKCFATGYPPPTVTWHKQGIILNTNQGRFGITSDGDLQIVQLHRTDSGIYVCIADNGLGAPVSRDVELAVNDPVDIESNAYILGESNSTMIVTLKQPATIRCLAGGYPKPYVSWWKGAEFVPLNSDHFEYRRDYSLAIHRVELNDLGPYICQAYTGRGKPVSVTVTLKAVGPVHTQNPEDQQYLQYLVDPPEVPTTIKPRSDVPYRPEPVPPRVIPPPVVVQPSFVPLKAYIRLPAGNQVNLGTDLDLECVPDGYPTPNITWFKNDRVIVQSSRILIAEPHSLKIYGVTLEDSGEYKCVVANAFSTAYHAEPIRVEGFYVPPDCKDSPFFADCGKIVLGRYCSHRYYAKFCCRSCTEAGQLSTLRPN